MNVRHSQSMARATKTKRRSGKGVVCEGRREEEKREKRGKDDEFSG
jgi:hypothetical protein